jgi:TetR/AcrR family transcriptional regulator, cholesterol catabolism regulator
MDMGNAVRVHELDLGDVTDTSTRVRAAAVYLFATRGYAASSIRDIAREVGITNAGVYHFVANKETLLLDLMREGQRSLSEATEASLAGVDRPEDRLALLISGLVGAHVVNRMISLVTDGEIRALAPGSEPHDEVVAMRDTYEASWRDVLRDGVDGGVFEVCDQSLTRLALLSMCTGVSEWYNPVGPADLNTITREFVGIGLAAVRARRDRRQVTVDDVPVVDPARLPRLPWEPRVKPTGPGRSHP